MSQKAKILMISYGTAALVALAGVSYALYGAAGSYRRYNDTEYRRAMAQLVTSMEELDSALQKGRYAAGTVVTGKVCAQVYASAQRAATALSILPLEQYELEKVSGFIGQMEDYAGAKVAAAADGKAFDDADRQTAGQLADITGRLAEELAGMYEELSGGGMTIRGPAIGGLTANVSDETGPILEDRLYDLADQFPQTPELNYDGRYSADRPRTWAALQGLTPVTQAQAQMVAQELLGRKDGELTALGRSEGEVPAYYFTVEDGQAEATVAVTEAGGKVLLYMSGKSADEERISEEQARTAADRFLERAGYEGMTAYEEHREWGLLERSYVYTAEEVTSLADRIQVAVSLADGEILSLNASDYLRYHTERETAAPAVSQEQAARQALPEGLEIVSASLSYYTAESGRTDLCWRFQCVTEEGQQCLIYASAETGEQMEIVTDTKTLVT